MCSRARAKDRAVSEAAAPLVSAIVPVYNGERFLRAALDSALAQTCQDIEIIVIDDGSKDSSGAIADEYAARHPGKFVVIHQPNGGLVVARNAGLAVARGRYVALLDADDEWLPHHLAASVEVLEKSPRRRTRSRQSSSASIPMDRNRCR